MARRTHARRAAAMLLAGMGGALVWVSAPARPAEPAPAGLVVDRVVLMMRHGVRPPTKSPPMPAAVTPDAWPDWPVAPGWLTTRGAVAVARLGADDGARYRKGGLLPARGCPAPGRIAVIADSDQRTIATADAWLGAIAPGCGLVSAHKPQDVPDPLFNWIEDHPADLDVARANADVAAAIGAGGTKALDAAQRALLVRLDRILCGSRKTACGVSAEPTGLVPAAPGARPKLKGALDRASTAAQILLLEYADGKPMAQVGWGRATAADVTALSAFHALEFRLLARPRSIAAANMKGLSARIVAAFTVADDKTAAVTMIAGHDTDVANLGGLLGVHWAVPGFAQDDPSPGGAIELQRLRDAKGALYVRAFYRSQTLEQIRSGAVLAGGAHRVAMPIEGCAAQGIAGLCPIARFEAKLRGE